MKKIVRYGYPRIHFSLIDMSAVSARMYGGCGISIKAPGVVAVASPSKQFNLVTSGQISSRKKQLILSAVERARCLGYCINCQIQVNSDIQPHVGLGSSSQVIISVLDAISAINGWSAMPEDIIRISGRGRTSLIGASTHYYGGFCIDAGQQYRTDALFLPSNTPEDRPPSLYVGRWNFPKEWVVVLLGTSSGLVISAEDERDFMANNTPLDREEGFQAIAALYHGILPAVISSDYDAFAQGLRQINLIGWKKLQRKLQPQNSIDALSKLWDMHFAAGISSFGPTIAVISRPNRVEEIRIIANQFGLSFEGPYEVINRPISTEEEYL